MFNDETTLASNSFNKMLKRYPEVTQGFTSINTPAFKTQWQKEHDLAEATEKLGSVSGMSIQEFSSLGHTQTNNQPNISFGAFSDEQKDFYAHHILKEYQQEFPNSAPLGEYHQGTWHGASRVPQGKHEGRYLKQIGHPTLHLALLSDLNYHNPAVLQDGVRVKDMDESKINGQSNPHSIYYTEENGQRVLYSFPRNRLVDSRFKKIEPEFLEMLLEPAYDLPDLNSYVMSNEVPVRRDGTPEIPGKTGDVYRIYPDSGKDKYLTIGIGHLVDPRKPESVTRTRRMLQQIDPLLDVQSIIRGEQGLTKSQVYQLFNKDVQEKIKTTQRVFPQLHTYPKEVQVGLIDATYWGMMGHSPTTRKLIKLGRIEEARDEWLNNDTYRRGESKYRFEKFYRVLDNWSKDKARWGRETR